MKKHYHIAPEVKEQSLKRIKEEWVKPWNGKYCMLRPSHSNRQKSNAKGTPKTAAIMDSIRNTKCLRNHPEGIFLPPIAQNSVKSPALQP